MIPSSPPARILVVEDEPKLAQLLADYLHAAQVIGEQVDGAVVVGAARRAAVGVDVVAQHRRSVSRAGQHMHFGEAGQRLAHAGGQSPHVVLGNRPRTIARHAEEDVLLGRVECTLVADSALDLRLGERDVNRVRVAATLA